MIYQKQIMHIENIVYVNRTTYKDPAIENHSTLGKADYQRDTIILKEQVQNIRNSYTEMSMDFIPQAKSISWNP